jgi:hypothetical protein
MKYTALINSGGVVINTLETNSENALEASPEQQVVEVTEQDYQQGLIGFSYMGGVFSAPIPPAPPPAPPPVQPPKHISVGAFFDRFGAQKYPILASADAGVRALITDCSVRKYIDLDNAQLPYGLDMLIAAGHAIDKEAILAAAIDEGERA